MHPQTDKPGNVAHRQAEVAQRGTQAGPRFQGVAQQVPGDQG